MLVRKRVRNFERGLWFRDGDFHRLLGPGAYRLWSRLWSSTRDRLEIVNTLETCFEHEMLDVLLADPEVRAALEVIDLRDTQRALLWKDGRLEEILGPGRHAFWREPYKLEVEVFDIDDLRFEHKQLETIVARTDAKAYLQAVDVPPTQEVLVLRNGELVEKLKPGRHIFWKGVGELRWERIDKREQTLEVSGQEIMTRDKVTLRVNLIVSYQVTDAEKSILVVADAGNALYREAQLLLRAAVGTRTLDALLTDKEAVGSEVEASLGARAQTFGVTVRSVGLRDIVLPGDMKLILNQVITAEKQAQANLIRRREETAAARSQANTAKLLEASPVLARMKELELLQEVLAGSKVTFVLGNGSSDLTDQVRSLVRPAAANGHEPD